MKIGTSWALILCCLIMTACSGVSNVSYPLSDGTFRNQRTVSDPHAFAPTHSRSWIEICQSKKGEAEPDYTNCQDANDARYATSSGYADGLGAAALQAGAIVGGAALIGNGLARSGSVTNQSGGGASQSQGQAQGQGQIQSQSQHGTVSGSNGHH